MVARSDPKKYGFKSFVDVRSAMSIALADYLKTFSFSFPATAEPFQFAKVYFDWATFQERAKGPQAFPMAAVLPEKGEIEETGFTPSEFEDTWNGGDGEGGFVLYKLGEYATTFTVLIRARTDRERIAMVRKIEEGFTQVGNDEDGDRFGVVLTLDRYFERKARFSLVAQEVVQTEDRALESIWMEYFSIEAQAPKVKAKFIPSLRPTEKFSIEGVRVFR